MNGIGFIRKDRRVGMTFTFVPSSRMLSMTFGISNVDDHSCFFTTGGVYSF